VQRCTVCIDYSLGQESPLWWFSSLFEGGGRSGELTGNPASTKNLVYMLVIFGVIFLKERDIVLIALLNKNINF